MFKNSALILPSLIAFTLSIFDMHSRRAPWLYFWAFPFLVFAKVDKMA